MASSKIQKAFTQSALMVAVSLLFFAPQAQAHSNHDHTQKPQTKTQNSQVKPAEPKPTTETTEAVQPNPATLSDDNDQTIQVAPSSAATTATLSNTGSVGFHEVLFGLILTAPPLLITFKKRLHSR